MLYISLRAYTIFKRNMSEQDYDKYQNLQKLKRRLVATRRGKDDATVNDINKRIGDLNNAIAILCQKYGIQVKSADNRGAVDIEQLFSDVDVILTILTETDDLSS